MAAVTASIGETNYLVTINAGRHVLTADEPPSNGGKDEGPGPYDLLGGALAACTAMTLRMYAERKQWILKSVQVDIHFRRTADKSMSVDRVLRLNGELTDEQRGRLADIAERTPVTLTLKSGVEIHTRLE